MSIDTRATYAQALHTLKLVVDQDLSPEETETFHQYLSILAKGAKLGVLPPPGETRALLNPFPDSVRRVVRDTPFHKGDLVLDEFFGADEPDVSGKEMLKRAWAAGPNLGYRDALRYQDNPDLLPEEAKGRVLVFAGTVVVLEDGGHSVPVLGCVAGPPYLIWHWLKIDPNPVYCLARPARST